MSNVGSEAFRFKSTGTTKRASVASSDVTAPSATTVGILTPMRLGESEIVAVSTTVAEQAHDNLRNLIQTNWGDRLGRYDYGADIRPIMFELNNSQDAFDSQAIARIKAAVGRWMPYVVLETFTSTIGRFNTISKTTIRLDITYSIPALDVTSRGLQVVLYSA